MDKIKEQVGYEEALVEHHRQDFTIILSNPTHIGLDYKMALVMKGMQLPSLPPSNHSWSDLWNAGQGDKGPLPTEHSMKEI